MWVFSTERIGHSTHMMQINQFEFLLLNRDECREFTIPSRHWHRDGIHQQGHWQCCQGKGKSWFEGVEGGEGGKGRSLSCIPSTAKTIKKNIECACVCVCVCVCGMCVCVCSVCVCL